MKLENAIFSDENKARFFLEKHLWPNGPICPHCQAVDKAWSMEDGKTARKGLYKCGECRKEFSVTVGTVFERSHVPLNKWLQCVFLLAASKKGISTHQIHRTIGVTYKTAWFMTHRVREAMKDPVFTSKLGGGGKVVEADETYWGNKNAPWKTRGPAHQEKIFSLVERGGKVRSYHVESVRAAVLKPIMQEQIHQDTAIMTDEMAVYPWITKGFASHETTKHRAKEYVRGRIHTNTVENYFSILKRGLSGVYQHVSAKHLRRYVGEFDFRYNHRDVTDGERATIALRGIRGKRLLYTKTSLNS